MENKTEHIEGEEMKEITLDSSVEGVDKVAVSDTPEVGTIVASADKIQTEVMAPEVSTTGAQGKSNKKVIIGIIIGMISVPVILFGGAAILGAVQGLNDISKDEFAVTNVQPVFISEEKDFQVVFPGIPLKEIESVPMEDGINLPTTMYSVTLKGVYYSVTSIDYSKAGLSMSGVDPKRVLNGAANGSVEELKSTIESLVNGEVGGYPSVDLIHSDASIRIHQRMILVGDSLYQIIVSEEKTTPNDSYKNFFDSFKYLGVSASSTSNN